MIIGPRLRGRGRCVPVVVSILCALVACTGNSHKDVAPKPVAPITVAAKPGWQNVTPTAEGLHSKAAALLQGSPLVSATLKLFADNDDLDDVRLVVLSRSSSAALVAQQQYDRTTPIADVVNRLQASYSSSGATCRLSQEQLHGKPVWRITFVTSDPGVVRADYWVDLSSSRYSLTVVGASGDVQALLDSVSFN